MGCGASAAGRPTAEATPPLPPSLPLPLPPSPGSSSTAAVAPALHGKEEEGRPSLPDTDVASGSSGASTVAATVALSPRTALVAAVRGDDANTVYRLLQADVGAARRRADGHDPTLLHVAAEAGAAEVICVLLAAGADTAAVDDDGQTPLHYAVANGHVAAVERLTAATTPCAEMHLTDRYKMQPLHLACEHGDPALIALLLARGARAITSPASPTRPPGTPVAASALVGVGEPAASGAAFAGGMIPSSPVPKRKQLIAMQQNTQVGGSAYFIAQKHEHHEAIRLLERAASGEAIPMPVVRERSSGSNYEFEATASVSATASADVGSPVDAGAAADTVTAVAVADPPAT